MSITIDERAAMSYYEMAIACSKDIEDYKTLLKSIEAMIAQKQRNLQSIKDKTVGLVKTALVIIPTQAIPVNQPAENFDDTGVDMVDDLTPEAVVEDSPTITPPKKERTQKSRTANRRKAAEKSRVKRADKPAERSQSITDIKCLHHPEASVTDVGRQLCSSCRWKLINNGLLKFDKEPEVKWS